jgi:hypothetical protein
MQLFDASDMVKYLLTKRIEYEVKVALVSIIHQTTVINNVRYTVTIAVVITSVTWEIKLYLDSDHQIMLLVGSIFFSKKTVPTKMVAILICLFGIRKINTIIIVIKNTIAVSMKERKNYEM